MLFVIEEDLGNSLIEGNSQFDEWYSAIDRILDGVKYHHHLFFTSQNNLDIIKERLALKLSDKHKSILNFISNNINDLKVVSDNLKCKCVISSKRVIDGNPLVKYVAPNQLDSLNESILVSENPKDFDFYHFVYKKIGEHGMFGVSFEEKTINGASIEEEYETIFRKCRPFLAINDSDKNHKNDHCGPSALKASDCLKAINLKYPFFHYVLDVKEKENLLPINIYKNEVFGLSKKEKSLINLVYKEGEDVWRYWDLKSGYKCWNIRKRKTDYKILSDRFLKSLMLKKHYSGDSSFFDNCLKSPKECNKKCESFANPISGIKIRIDDISKYDHLVSLNMFPEALLNEWKTIHDLMFGFGCCFGESVCFN